MKPRMRLHGFLDAGGVTEIGRWSSEATTTGSPSKMKCAPDGVRENVRTKKCPHKISAAPSGADVFSNRDPVVFTRWARSTTG